MHNNTPGVWAEASVLSGWVRSAPEGSTLRNLRHVGFATRTQRTLAQATVLLAVSPKSDAIGRGYAAAMEEVLGLGALPVPGHLRNAADRRMKAHGIGVGYRNPHDFEGDDVEQQYLPDALVGRRFYVPSDQGQDANIAARMEARAEARRQPPRRKKVRYGVDTMSVFGGAMKSAGEARAKMAAEQKKDAGE